MVREALTRKERGFPGWASQGMVRPQPSDTASLVRRQASKAGLFDGQVGAKLALSYPGLRTDSS